MFGNISGAVWMAYDLAAVAILLYYVGRAASRGFARTLVSFLGYMLAAVIAGTCGGMVAQLLYDNLVYDIMRLAIIRQVESAIADGGAGLAELLPAGLQALLQSSGSEFLEMLFDGDAGKLAEAIIESTLESPVMSILSGICFFAVFSASLFFTRRIGRLFGGLYRVPVLGTVNTFLGGVVGVGQSVLLLYLSGILLRVVITATSGQIEWLNEEIINDTFIYRVFYNFG